MEKSTQNNHISKKIISPLTPFILPDIPKDFPNIVFNTGRWTEEEHQKFIEGILKYGNDWKNVQQIIGTRSSTQARSHAQKFVLNLRKIINKNKIDSKENLIKLFLEQYNNGKNIELSSKQKEKLLSVISLGLSEDFDNNIEKKKIRKNINKIIDNSNSSINSNNSSENIYNSNNSNNNEIIKLSDINPFTINNKKLSAISEGEIFLIEKDAKLLNKKRYSTNDIYNENNNTNFNFNKCINNNKIEKINEIKNKNESTKINKENILINDKREISDNIFHIPENCWKFLDVFNDHIKKSSNENTEVDPFKLDFDNIKDFDSSEEKSDKLGFKNDYQMYIDENNYFENGTTYI